MNNNFKIRISRNIDESSFGNLYDELEKIEKPYQGKLYKNNPFIITDMESLLCYEQGKYLENVEWSGNSIEDIPCIEDIPDVEMVTYTYNRMDYYELQYYLYWRSCFRKGKYIKENVNPFSYLYACELIADLGPLSNKERLEHLIKLHELFGNKNVKVTWIKQYAEHHKLEIEDDNITEEWNNRTQVSRNQEKRNKIIYENINKGDYTDVFEIMYSQSVWKCNKSAFVKKTDSLQYIEEVIRIMFPKFERLFEKEGISFTTFLVGKTVKSKSKQLLYKGSVWNECVQVKFGAEPKEFISYERKYPSGEIYITDFNGNIKRKTITTMRYEDSFLSEYILRYTEMLFRKETGYKRHISIPEKPCNVLKKKFAYGYEFILSADPQFQHDQKIYLSLYDKIECIIIESVEEYMSEHKEEISAIKKLFNEKKSNSIKSKKDVTSIRQAEYDLIERNQSIDDESIQKAREVLRKNQARLVIEEILEEKEEKQNIESVEQLSSQEKQFLQVLLDGKNIKEKMVEFEKQFISINLLIENINSKSMDRIGDSIIECDGEPSIVKDYLDEVRNLLK